jgi:putative SOS response-associated peptidase YedK
MNQLGLEFGAQLRAGVREPAPNLDVRPTTPVPFLQGRLGEDGVVRRELSIGRWGMIPTFAKAFESKFATFNAPQRGRRRQADIQELCSAMARRCPGLSGTDQRWSRTALKVDCPSSGSLRTGLSGSSL